MNVSTELSKMFGDTYGIEAEHRSKVVRRVIIFDVICTKTELSESSAKKES